jgi:hypothetical protein
MITNIPLWIESNERDITVKGYHQTSYGFPRSYYKISHYTDELLFHLSYQSLRLWHKSMSMLSTSKDAPKCVTLDLHYKPFKDDFNRSSFYTAIKELVRYRLLLETDQKSVYVVNIQHAHKLNSPSSYKPVYADEQYTKARHQSVDAGEVYDDGDNRPLAF